MAEATIAPKCVICLNSIPAHQERIPASWQIINYDPTKDYLHCSVQKVCDHVFCATCLKTAGDTQINNKQESTCPLCRKKYICIISPKHVGEEINHPLEHFHFTSKKIHQMLLQLLTENDSDDRKRLF